MTQDDVWENEVTYEEVREIPVWKRILVAAIALLAAVGMFWTYQLRPLFLYRETTPAVVEPIPPTAPDASQETLSVPLHVFIMRGSDNAASTRDATNAQQLTESAEAVWNQAGIAFDVRAITEKDFGENEHATMLDDPVVFWSNLREDSANTDAVLVVLTRHLRGINGIAWPGLHAFAVADTTTVPDWRAYAHELGHILGLSHTDNTEGRLLYQGANGTMLTKKEIETAREAAALLWEM